MEVELAQGSLVRILFRTWPMFRFEGSCVVVAAPLSDWHQLRSNVEEKLLNFPTEQPEWNKFKCFKIYLHALCITATSSSETKSTDMWLFLLDTSNRTRWYQVSICYQTFRCSRVLYFHFPIQMFVFCSQIALSPNTLKNCDTVPLFTVEPCKSLLPFWIFSLFFCIVAR